MDHANFGGVGSTQRLLNPKACPNPHRTDNDGDERRSLDEVAMPELVGLALRCPDLSASDAPALALAREIGLARLAKSARERLEAAIELAVEKSNRDQPDS